MLPFGVDRDGASSPGCWHGPYAACVRQPFPGSTRFALSCSGAPPNAYGAMLVGLPTPFGPVLGADILVQPIVGATVLSDGLGLTVFALPIAASMPQGVQAGFQFPWPIAAPCGPLIASDALDVTVQ